MATIAISAAGGNSNAVGTWDGGIVPVGGDAVVARGGGDSGNLTINATFPATTQLASFVMTNYVGTLTINSGITMSVGGAVTLVAGMANVAGTGILLCNATATLTSGGKTLAGGLTLSGTSQTYTLSGNWVVGTDFKISATTGVTVGGTQTITCATMSLNSQALAITLTLNLTSITASGALTLNDAVSTTFAGAGTVSAASCTISNTETVTPNGQITITGLTTISDATVLTGTTWTTQGLTVSGALTGTCVIHFSGSGTWTGATVSSCSVTVDGDTTLSGTVLYAASGTPTLTLASGSLLTGTLSIATATTIVGHATKVIANVTISAALTLTINTPVLLITGTLTGPNAAVTFAGTAGFTAATLANTAIAASAKTYTLTQGNTYTCTTAFNWTGATSALTLTMISSHATNKVTFTLNYGATQNSIFVVFTRISAGAGQCLFSAQGTVTTSFNCATTVTSGNIINAGGGEALTVAGVTYNNVGAILGSCLVYLFRDNGDNTATYIAQQTSNASTGAYSFTCFPGSTYFTLAFLEGSPDVFDITDRELVAA